MSVKETKAELKAEAAAEKAAKEAAKKEPLSLEHVITAILARVGPMTLSPDAMEAAKSRRLGIDQQDDGSVALEVT